MSDALPVTAGIGAAAMAGFYGTFSGLVMPALSRLPASDAVRAMQGINRMAPLPWTAFALVATGGSAAMTAARARRTRVPASNAHVAGSALYLASVALTIGYHIPRNNRLGRTAPGEAHQEWERFAQGWARANHLRAALSLGAAVLLLWPVGSSPSGDDAEPGRSA